MAVPRGAPPVRGGGWRVPACAVALSEAAMALGEMSCFDVSFDTSPTWARVGPLA